MAILFISDTHLGEGSKDSYITQNIVIDCIKQHQKTLTDLYLLGDIFNIWIGDAQRFDEKLLPFINYLQSIANTCNIYFMHGNRDFLVNHNFCKHIPCKLINDPTCITLDTKKILLTHGDLLCIDDINYQKLRKIIRRTWIQKIFLSIPYKIRYNIANFMRKLSIKSQKSIISQSKNYKKVDVNLQELNAWYLKYGFDILLHGHTHVSGKYIYQGYERLVLSDWHSDGGTYAIFDGKELKIEKFII